MTIAGRTKQQPEACRLGHRCGGDYSRAATSAARQS